MPLTSVRKSTACSARLSVRIQRATRKLSTMAGCSAVDQLGLDAKDAEDQRQHRAADVEEELAHVDDAPGEILAMLGDVAVGHGLLDRRERLAVEPGRPGEVLAAEDQADQHRDADH